MLTMAVILAVLSAWVELKFVRKIKPIHWLMTEAPGAAIINLVFSVGMSMILGEMFGVAGLIAFLGGLGSTFITNMYYPNEERIKQCMTAAKAAPSKIKATKDRSVSLYNEFKQPVQDFMKLVKWILKIITFPFVVIRWCNRKYTTVRIKFNKEMAA